MTTVQLHSCKESKLTTLGFPLCVFQSVLALLSYTRFGQRTVRHTKILGIVENNTRSYLGKCLLGLSRSFRSLRRRYVPRRERVGSRLITRTWFGEML